MENNRHYLGSEKKLAITITCQGFSMDSDPWKVTITNGCKQVVCDKSKNTARDANGQWYLLVDTDQLGVGKPKAIIDIDVPDSDFEDEYRHEVYVYQLEPIVRP